MTEYLSETVFTWGATPLKFGPGAIDEIGFDLSQLGAQRVLLVTDRFLAGTGIPQRIADGAAGAGLHVEVFDGVQIEPTADSINLAVEFAAQSEWDGFIAVGGGSVIDTAKAINLLTTYPGKLLDYVNQPIGLGNAPAGPLKPLVAVPTTAGTGSESTPVCVLDFVDLKVKSGISHPRLRPTMAVVDPLTTLSLPPAVTAASGMDVLCHALESYIAKPYTAFPRHSAEKRVAYCGSNPISDLWAERALELLGRSLRRAVHSGNDLDARTDVMLAATMAGMGFGNAGVHIPHANGYPIAGRVRDYTPVGYPGDEPLVPHGQSVSLTAPAAFRFTFPADPDRHVRAAELLDPHVTGERRERLPSALVSLMLDIGIPNGISGVGYGESDVTDLVSGTVQQQRLLSVAPRIADADALGEIFRESVRNW